jgi:uncharacterized protein YjiS (DUF1127 family)
MTTLLKNFLQKLRNFRQYRQSLNELSKLTDRELNDIGIGRGDIYRVAKGDKSYQVNHNLKGWV